MSDLCLPLAPHVFAIDRRRAARADVAIAATLRDREGQMSEARILNLSSHGFMAESATQWCERAPVRVELGGLGWARATIVWALGDRFGAAFRAPLPDDVVEQLTEDTMGDYRC